MARRRGFALVLAASCLAAPGPAALVSGALFLEASCAEAEGDGFGVSPQSPIGTRARIEARLREARLAPRPAEERNSEDMGGAFRVAPWVDEEASARVGASEHVQLLLGLDGSLRGVAGAFTAPGGSERVRALLQRYWEEVAGSPPRFEAQAGASEWTPASEKAAFSGAGGRGTWVRMGASESVRIRARETGSAPRKP